MALNVTSDVRRPPAALARLLELRAPGIWTAFGEAVERLDRRVGPAVVTSWWRDATTNARAGGSPQSQHLLGTALDLVGDTARIAMVARDVGFVVMVESDHVHLQAWPAGAPQRAGLFRAAFRA